MKTYLLLLLLLLFSSCVEEEKFFIKGTLPSVAYDGEWVFLVPLEGHSPETVDSVIISNASFCFAGVKEQMSVIRTRLFLRRTFQELLVVTEPGTIFVALDSVSTSHGTPQNNALQAWKERKVQTNNALRFVKDGLKCSEGSDSLQLLILQDSLLATQRDYDFNLILQQKNSTLGVFIKKMAYSSLLDEQKKSVDE